MLSFGRRKKVEGICRKSRSTSLCRWDRCYEALSTGKDVSFCTSRGPAANDGHSMTCTGEESMKDGNEVTIHQGRLKRRRVSNQTAEGRGMSVENFRVASPPKLEKQGKPGVGPHIGVSKMNNEISRFRQTLLTAGEMKHPRAGETQFLTVVEEEKNSCSRRREKDSRELELYRKLSGGRFRYLNEQFYVTKGSQMFQKLKESPELFNEYHNGYREQVKGWKRNPTDLIIKWLKEEVAETATVADLGCGEAHVAKTLPHRKILSYDLVSSNPNLVIAANIANLPLENDKIDVCIFCLSLMGTDWPIFIREAHRVLKIGSV